MALFLGLGTAGCSSPPASHDDKQVMIALHGCDKEHRVDPRLGARCGEFEVFEDRNAGAGRRITLKIMVLEATGNNPQPDPLFVLAGGPGQGATEIAPAMVDTLESILRDRDIVFVDQRGTGSSSPLDCVDDEDSLEALFRVEPRLKPLKTCLAGYDADPRLYLTDDAMDDLNDVRNALGYSSINLFGISYGTRAALVYMRRHPDTVRSAILDAVAPVSLKLPLHQGEDGQRALELLFSACEGDPVCAERFPRLREHYGALIQRLRRAPARVRLSHPRTGEPEDLTVHAQNVAGALHGALYAGEIASLIPLAIERAFLGDFQQLAAMSVSASGAGDSISVGMHLSVICAEDFAQISVAERAEILASESILDSGAMASMARICENWPTRTLDPEYFLPVESDLPVLLLSGQRDPITPPRWAEEVKSTLSNARHVVVPGVGHGVWNRGCVPELMEEFLSAGGADGIDMSCVDSHHAPPFFLSNAGPRAVPPRGGTVDNIETSGGAR